MSTPLKIGDVFAIPLGDGRAGVGQVVGTYGTEAYFFAVFDAAFPDEDVKERSREALSERVLLLALSLDAKLHAGHWRIIDSAAVPDRVVLPAYKEAVGDATSFDIVNAAGNQRRPAGATEVELLHSRKVVAPVRLEKALRAWLGLEPWLDLFDDLRADRQVAETEFFDRY